MHCTVTARFAIAAVCSAAVLSSGCAGTKPQWHTGEGEPLRHHVLQAAVYDGSLSISGTMDRLAAFTDYGIKVYEAVDDQGTTLEFRSFQIFWMKVMCFEIEFSQPHPDAQRVHFDIAFTSRSGVDRLKGSVPILREPNRNYLMQLDRWKRSQADVS